MDNMNVNTPAQVNEPAQKVELKKYEEIDVVDSLDVSVVKKHLMPVLEKNGISVSSFIDDKYSNNYTIEQLIKNAWGTVRMMTESHFYKEKKVLGVFKSKSYEKDLKMICDLITEMDNKVKNNDNKVTKLEQAISRKITSMRKKYKAPPAEKNQIFLLDDYIKDTMLCVRVAKESGCRMDEAVYEKTMETLLEMRRYLNNTVCDGFSVTSEEYFLSVVDAIKEVRNNVINDLHTDTLLLERSLMTIKDKWTKLDTPPSGKNKATSSYEIVKNDDISKVIEYAPIEKKLNVFFDNMSKFKSKNDAIISPKQAELDELRAEKEKLLDEMDELDILEEDRLISRDAHDEKMDILGDRLDDLEDRIFDAEDDLSALRAEMDDYNAIFEIVEEMNDFYNKSLARGYIPEIVEIFKEDGNFNYAKISGAIRRIDTLSDLEFESFMLEINALTSTYVEKRDVLAKRSSRVSKMLKEMKDERLNKARAHEKAKEAQRIEKDKERQEREAEKQEMRDAKEKAREEKRIAREKIREGRNNRRSRDEEDEEYQKKLDERRKAREARGGGAGGFDPNGGFAGGARTGFKPSDIDDDN